MYLFYYKRFELGGAELLIEKIARELIARGEKVYIVCESISDIMKKRFNKLNINLVKNVSIYKDAGWLKKILTQYQESISFVCFQLFDYCMINHYLRKCDKLLLYIMHFNSLKIGYKGHLGFLKLLWKKTMPSLIIDISKNNGLVFMDETCVDEMKSFYHQNDLDLATFDIIRLPIDIVPISESELRKKAEIKGIHILSIARADFPFKGYLIGLVKLFGEINSNVNLTIVSYGKDIIFLEKEIEKLPKTKKDKLCLIGETNFEELEQLFSKSNLYIGMGTTVLDATLRGVVSLPIKAYTYEVFAKDFFYNDYKKIVETTESRLNQITRLLHDFNLMTPNRYLEKSISGRNLVIHHYGTQYIVDKIEQKLIKNINFKNFTMELVWFIQKIKFRYLKT